MAAVTAAWSRRRLAANRAKAGRPLVSARRNQGANAAGRRYLTTARNRWAQANAARTVASCKAVVRSWAVARDHSAGRGRHGQASVVHRAVTARATFGLHCRPQPAPVVCARWPERLQAIRPTREGPRRVGPRRGPGTRSAAGILADRRSIPVQRLGNGPQGLADGDPLVNPGPEILPALGDRGRRRAGRAGRLDGGRGGAPRAHPVLGEHPLQDLPPIVPQVKAVGDLQRRGRPGGDSAGQPLITVARQPNGRMSAEPRRHRLRTHIGQHVHNGMVFRVHQDSGIGTPRAERPLIKAHDPDVPHRGIRGRPAGAPPRIRTDRAALLGGHPGAIGGAGRPPPLGERRPHGGGPPLMRPQPGGGPALTEDPWWTARGVAPARPTAQRPADGNRPPRPVLPTAPVEAMDPVAHVTTPGTRGAPQGEMGRHEHRDAIPDDDLDPDGQRFRYNRSRQELTSLPTGVFMSFL
jgi:hypothetical protein